MAVRLGWTGAGILYLVQVIDGMDIVESISHVSTNPENNKPKESVYIESVTVEQYDGE